MTQLVPYDGPLDGVLTNIILRGDGTMIRIIYNSSMQIVHEQEIRKK